MARLSTAQKSAKGVSLYSRYVNRPVGRVLAVAAYRLGLSPNQVTLLSAAVTLGGMVVLGAAAPSWGSGVAVALLLALGFALDSADGQVARLTGRGSPAGEWLDHVVDAGKMTLLHAAVLVQLLRHPLPALPGEHSFRWDLGIPLAFQAVAVLLFTGGLLADLLHRARTAAAPAPAPAAAPAAPARERVSPRALALLPADYGVLCWTFLLLGAPTAHFWLYTALLALNALTLAALLRKWFHSLAVS